MGVMAPLLPSRPCRGPRFLFSLLLTRLMISLRKSPGGERVLGVKENGARSPGRGRGASQHLLQGWGTWGSPFTCSEPCFPHFQSDIKNSCFRSSHYGSVVTSPTSIHEDVGSIPGHTQWVKDPVLL